jgi:hypothetical protein
MFSKLTDKCKSLYKKYMFNSSQFRSLYDQYMAPVEQKNIIDNHRILMGRKNAGDYDKHPNILEERLAELAVYGRIQQTKNKKGIITGCFLFAAGAAVMAAEVYFDLKIKDYTCYIPELAITIGGLSHALNSFSSYTDLEGYLSIINKDQEEIYSQKTLQEVLKSIENFRTSHEN